MPTRRNPAQTRLSAPRPPLVAHQLWNLLPTTVRAPVLQILSQMLAHQWQEAVDGAHGGNRSGDHQPRAGQE